MHFSCGLSPVYLPLATDRIGVRVPGWLTCCFGFWTLFIVVMLLSLYLALFSVLVPLSVIEN